jgi:hypothetical protein
MRQRDLGAASQAPTPLQPSSDHSSLTSPVAFGRQKIRGVLPRCLRRAPPPSFVGREDVKRGRKAHPHEDQDLERDELQHAGQQSAVSSESSPAAPAVQRELLLPVSLVDLFGDAQSSLDALAR